MKYESDSKPYSIIVAVLCALLAVGSMPVRAQQDVGVTATADSSSIVMGSWIHLTLQAKHSASTNITWQALKDSLGPFEIVQADTAIKIEQANGMVTETRSVIVSRYQPGNSVIPPVTVSYRMPNDTAVTTAQSNPIPIEVRGIAVDTSLAIKDIKPPMTVPMSLEEILALIGIILALGAIGYGGYWYWKKRKQKALGIVEEKPPVPPEVLALTQLHELEAKKVWQKGEIKLFYSEATEIVRRYFEGRYGVMALEMTTDEVLDQLAAFKLSREMVDSIRSFLADADMVKFAKVVPSISDNERVIPVAESIVEKTTAMFVPPVVPEPVAATPVASAPAAPAEGGSAHV